MEKEKNSEMLTGPTQTYEKTNILTGQPAFSFGV